MDSRRKHRNLGKHELGGVIFGCTNDTKSECLAKQLFGLPSRHFSYVKLIEPGLPLFLFNYSERKLYGIYEAVSSGKMCIDTYAWTDDGSDKTSYPAQVQVRIRLECQALVEQDFKPIIADNYYNHHHFFYELDHVQASQLISKLSAFPLARRMQMPRSPSKFSAETQSFPLSFQGNESRPYAISQSLADDFANSDDSFETFGNSDDTLCLDQNKQLMDTFEVGQTVELDEKELIYSKLKELSVCHRHSDATLIGGLGGENYESAAPYLENRNSAGQSYTIDSSAIIAKLCEEVEELKAFKQQQTLKMGYLEKKLADAELEIHRLAKVCTRLESLPDPFINVGADEAPSESPEEFHSCISSLIFLVGGYNGASWTSALHSFSPSDDVLKSHKPMSHVRSYASVSMLNDELFVVGGGKGSVLYDTVESYNPVINHWTLHPSLNRKKSNLASASSSGKIYAIGGGNGVECFSDVEMLDLDVGRWICTRSMLQKRFSVAAVELNGVLYAVGGYDGDDYLKSAERFDPREHSWSRIESMNIKRGCHSLVVMNEKLFAIGGFNGIEMVPSVEVYDPRLGTWMNGQPLNQGRGYSAAAVFKDSIYVIGGVKADEDISDKIECYKEGQGWEETNLKGVGKVCFASAIVL